MGQAQNERKNCMCEKGGVNSNIYFAYIFSFFLLFIIYIYIHIYEKNIYKKKNSKSLTSGQGFTVELKRIKQGTKRKRRTEGRKSEGKKKRERKKERDEMKGTREYLELPPLFLNCSAKQHNVVGFFRLLKIHVSFYVCSLCIFV